MSNKLLSTDEMKEWRKILTKSNNTMLFSTELMKKTPKISKNRFDFVPKNKKGPFGPFKFQKVIYETLAGAL